MFGYQHILEVIHSLQAHKIRTIFTGFGVMWAMLILVLLQGAGTGLYNGMIKKFRGYIGRTLSIYPGYSAVSEIELTESLSGDLANHLTIFEQVIPVFHKTTSLSYGEVPYKGSVIGVGLGYEQIGNLALVEGRFFTERDLAARLPVCILGLHKKEQIFDSEPAIGQFITIEGNMVCVIGVLEDTTGVDNKRIIIPSSLFKALFPKHAQSIDHITSTLTPRQSPIQAKAKVRAYLARRLGFALEDRDALHIYSSNQARIFQLLFTAMQAVIWLVSLCFLISGVVGVGNMMLVVVKDRTQELAIRKVIGAQASDIIGLVVMESIVINLIAGIFGLGIGMAVLRWINTYLVPIMANHGIARFEFQSSMILAALVILVLSGGFAGIIPAKRALCIKPVDALNN